MNNNVVSDSEYAAIGEAVVFGHLIHTNNETLISSLNFNGNFEKVGSIVIDSIIYGVYKYNDTPTVKVAPAPAPIYQPIVPAQPLIPSTPYDDYRNKIWVNTNQPYTSSWSRVIDVNVNNYRGSTVR